MLFLLSISISWQASLLLLLNDKSAYEEEILLLTENNGDNLSISPPGPTPIPLAYNIALYSCLWTHYP